MKYLLPISVLILITFSVAIEGTNNNTPGVRGYAFYRHDSLKHMVWERNTVDSHRIGRSIVR